MTSDEQAIREMVARWMEATKAGDTPAVLSLMTEDVVFMTPGNPPFGKEGFAANSAGMKDMKVEGTAEVMEVNVQGDWAWMRNKLRVTVTPPGGKAMTRAGFTLTILRKSAEGRWQIARDANLLAPEAGAQS